MTRPLDIVPTLARALVCATVALSLPACGNYSNEDLEYMSAIPQRDDVAIEVPRRGMLVAATAAEGWRTTLDVTRSLNRVADAFLSLVEKIRTYSPTKRLPDERVWGPYPAEDHPGLLQQPGRLLVQDSGASLDVGPRARVADAVDGVPGAVQPPLHRAETGRVRAETVNQHHRRPGETATAYDPG